MRALRARTAAAGRLEAVFERSVRALASGVPIRRTSAGIWAPSPLPVIVQVVTLLRELGLLGRGAPPGAVVDAGMGDGRVAALIARLEPSRRVCGIECDPVLHARAVENLRRVGVHAGVRAVAGDYCDPAAYASCGLDLREVGVVVNYPDGNQDRLARFVAAHAGPDASLCLFTHDRGLEVDALPLRAQRDLPVDDGDDGLGWRLSVYRGAGR